MSEQAGDGDRVQGPSTSADTQPLYEQLRQKNTQIAVLQKKLLHFRRWISSVHGKVQVMNPQAIKNSRKLYVGNIPADTSEEELKDFLNALMIKIGALTSPGLAITSCRITPEKSFAFIELRSVEETTNALCLDGVSFKDGHLKIRRPSNYDISTAIMLGPVSPDPTLDTSQLDICRTVVDDSPSKLFVGGLSCEWSEEQVKELLTPFGNLRSFNLVMDKSSGKSKGYAFCEYADDSATDVAIQALNQRKARSRTLTVKRALEGQQSSSTGEESLFGMMPGYSNPQSPALSGQMTPTPTGFAGFNVGQAAYPMAGIFPLPMQPMGPTTPAKMYPGGPGVGSPAGTQGAQYGSVHQMPPGGSSSQASASLPGYDISSMPWL